MGRYKKDVKYWNKGGYRYYKTRDMSGYMSTGEKNKTKAEAVVAKLRQKNIAGIRRGDLLDFRSSLQTKGVSGNNINSIMKAIKVVFSEAVLLQVRKKVLQIVKF